MDTTLPGWTPWPCPLVTVDDRGGFECHSVLGIWATERRRRGIEHALRLSRATAARRNSRASAVTVSAAGGRLAAIRPGAMSTWAQRVPAARDRPRVVISPTRPDHEDRICGGEAFANGRREP